MQRKVYSGPRGGRYYITKNGNRVYLKSSSKSMSIVRSKTPKPVKSNKKYSNRRAKSYSRTQTPSNSRYGKRSGVPVVVDKYNGVEVVKPKTMRGRGSSTKGWKKDSPKRGEERHSISRRCPNCFLMPKEEKFPICDINCKIDCRAINSAYIRARQHKYPKVATRAKTLKQRYGCVSPKSPKSPRRR